MTDVDPQDLAEARVLLRRAGFPVDRWDDEELKTRVLAMSNAMVAFAKAVQPLFAGAVENMADLFRKLAVVAEAIDAEGEKSDRQTGGQSSTTT